MKINLLFILFLMIIPVDIFAQEEPKEEPLEVVVGIDQVIKLDFNFSTKIQIGNESLLELVVAPQKKEITFRGLKPGNTSVMIRDNLGEIKKRYIVNVTATALSKTVQELRDLIGDVEGVQIVIKGGKVVMEGELVVPGDIGRIAAVLPNYEDVLVLIELSPLTRKIVAQKMAEEIQKSGMKDVTVRVVNKAYWLEGVVNSNGQKKLAMTIAEAYLPDDIASLSSGSDRVKTAGKNAIYDFISVNTEKKPQPPPKQVKVASQFVELSKDYSKIFAFKWSPLIGEDGSQINIGKTSEGDISTKSSGTLSAVISNLFPKLTSAKNAGYARLIQSGMVITQDQQQASVNKDSQYSFGVGGGEFQQKGDAKVGFQMGVTPKILEQEKIEMSLQLTVSVPNGTSSQGTPIIATNSVQTNVVVKSKQSAAIGGVVQNSSVTGYDKDDPDGGAAVEGGSPLLFFLRSKSFNTSKNQYVVFVTPEIIESASMGVEEVRRKFRKRGR